MNNQEIGFVEDIFNVSIASCNLIKDFIFFPSHCYDHHGDDEQVRADKAEEEVAELMKKAEQLEVELDKTKEELVSIVMMIMWMVMLILIKS